VKRERRERERETQPPHDTACETAWMLVSFTRLAVHHD
jgi:hypothetical protein